VGIVTVQKLLLLCNSFKKRIVKYYLYLFGLIIITLSCKKSNEDLIVGVWKMEKVEFSEDGLNYIIDEESCLNDDYYIFNKDGSLDYNRGLTCAGDTDHKTTWYLKDDGITITYIYEGYAGEYYATIKELTRKTLITTHKALPFSETSPLYKYTFSKE